MTARESAREKFLDLIRDRVALVRRYRKSLVDLENRIEVARSNMHPDDVNELLHQPRPMEEI